MTDRTLTVTKQQDGTYRAERGGRVVVVRPGQVMGDEAIDRQRAEYDALEALGDPTVRMIDDREDPADRARVDAERAEAYAALVRWKVAAYGELVRVAGRNPPKELTAKRDDWVSESQRLGRSSDTRNR